MLSSNLEKGYVMAGRICWKWGLHLSAVAAENAQASWSRRGRPDSLKRPRFSAALMRVAALG